ncbi:hypothetical protein IGI04_034446 [Brassica rapa subsp. trilocularis]|uniref:Non-specific serine/threonine protein kinase n=1 Tax=Brassica rapa subsp. trilocularis TaxID=1813537 RepID=A0ABQ7LB09_BRACM|nr:hypothetical protein IGI04_034446 [Brassica rapa subsp. trilocularis]
MVFFLFFLLISIFSTCGNADINTSSPLSIGQTLSSPNGVYELGFFSPNNTLNKYVGVWFKNITPQVVVWVANRDKPVTKTAANLTISSNGSLILLDGKQDVIWSTGEAFTSKKCHAELLDTGNLVVTDDVSGKTLWQSFGNLGNTMLPQSSVSYDIPRGKKHVLTSWKSNNDPSPGEYSLEFTPQVPPQGLIRRGSKPYWRSGPWAKTKFSGIPGIDASYVSPFTVVQDVEKGTASFSYSQLRNYKLSYVTLTSEGKMKILWSDGKNWTLHFAAPVSSCDLYGACGPFGLCLRTSTPKCVCMKGFVPKSDEEWRQRNWTSGCVRHTQLSCQANSSTKTQGKEADIFYHMKHVKTPDMYQFASFLNAEQCHQGCLGNCSCTAFAYISGIGCLVWNRELVDTVQFSSDGESLSLRLASSELVGSSRTMIIAGATASLSLLTILVFSAYTFWRYRAKQNVAPNFMFINTSQDARRNDLEPQDVSGINFFEMHTIRTATNNFSFSNKLGQGGFGPVYKGKLVDGKEIAVKRLSSSSGQGTEEFMNEITLISKLQHRNLVRLLGCCIKGEEKLLIYEFLENKSLDVFLFDSTLKFEIDWTKRFDIIQGIARGLLYLHRDSRLRVIHRDLKVSNILLDERMIPKISDFGLARMFQGTHFQDNTRRVVGTLGYMSPEYAWTGVFSEKSDIYAFGVLLLEIISGEKISRFNNGEEGNNLIAYAWECWCETKGVDFLDQDIADSCCPLQVSRCVQIGLICVQHQPVERPNTVELLSMLTTTLVLPSPKQPIFALHSRGEESTSNDVITVNGLTQSGIQGPINSSSPLSIRQTLSSPGGFYELGFFSPNNTGNQYIGIWFKKIVPRVIVWVANRDKPVTSSAANLTISRNGSLILVDEKQAVIWSTGEASFPSSRSHAELLDTGNLVLIDDVSRTTIWESFENLGNTMLPQSTLMYDLSHGKKRELTSWKSYSDPSLGNFSLEITPQVPLQGLIRRGSVPYWRTGPWAKTRFTGFPQFDESYVSPFSVVQDLATGTGSFSYSTLRNFNLSYLTLTPEGNMEIYWDQGQKWMHHLTEPEHSCDIYGTCGPFGLCVRSSTPRCICLKGFVPKKDVEWRKGNWTSGCVRRAQLSCQAKSSTKTQGRDTDIFYRMTNVKTPDLHQFASFLDADMCYQGCLGNCSCTAFAYISGIGCLVWNGKLVDTVQFMSNGETISIRLASSELAGSHRTKIIVATTACLSIFAILVFTAFMFWRYRAKQKEPTHVGINTLQNAWKNDFEPQDISGVNFFEMHTIRTATDNFSSSNKLGQGGFGPVYKGKLLDGKEIAAKRLSSSSDQGTGEFLNEIRLISKLQHRNLVRLLGYCIEGEEKLLIYEFMVNKSLDIFLFDSTLKLEIDWAKRFEIIQGIARGLLYLHRDSRLRVIHRDLKVSNILLDEKMNPKISDFGLARMFQGTQYQDNTRRVVGTLGYMSPEYAWAGLFSEKSDIYSLGVLMLEIISGKKISRFSFGDGSKGLLAYAWESWCETGGADLLDQDLTDSCNIYEVARCVQIGLLCVQHEASDRPNTLQVLSMITSTTELPTPKQPIFAAQTLNDVFTSESESKHIFSVNDLTQSVIQGR